VEIEVLMFGNLVQVVGRNHLVFNGIDNTAALVEKVHSDFPLLTATSYSLAVNGQLVRSVCLLKNGDEIAFLPQFSGG
jgi:molybdopterin converting factor small subunit